MARFVYQVDYSGPGRTDPRSKTLTRSTTSELFGSAKKALEGAAMDWWYALHCFHLNAADEPVRFDSAWTDGVTRTEAVKLLRDGFGIWVYRAKKAESCEVSISIRRRYVR